MKDYSLRNKTFKLIDIISKLINNHITEAFENGYEQGYNDAKSELGQNAIDLAHEESDRAYRQGLDDAWVVIKKITKDETVGGYSFEMIRDIFSSACVYDIVRNYTAEEAIAKIKEYEDKQKQDTIRIGDEIETKFGTRGVVITDTPDEEGTISVWFRTDAHVQSYPVKDLMKTGRHFDQIILPKMGDGEC